MKKGMHKRSKNSEFQDKCRKTKNRWNRSVRAITHVTVKPIKIKKGQMAPRPR